MWFPLHCYSPFLHFFLHHFSDVEWSLASCKNTFCLHLRIIRYQRGIWFAISPNKLYISLFPEYISLSWILYPIIVSPFHISSCPHHSYICISKYTMSRSIRMLSIIVPYGRNCNQHKRKSIFTAVFYIRMNKLPSVRRCKEPYSISYILYTIP